MTIPIPPPNVRWVNTEKGNKVHLALRGHGWTACGRLVDPFIGTTQGSVGAPQDLGHVCARCADLRPDFLSRQ